MTYCDTIDSVLPRICSAQEHSAIQFYNCLGIISKCLNHLKSRASPQTNIQSSCVEREAVLSSVSMDADWCDNGGGFDCHGMDIIILLSGV